MSGPGLMAVFRYEDDLWRAAKRLHEAGYDGDDMVFIGPVPLEHGRELVFGSRRSAVRRFSLAGALLGGAGGFTLAVFCATVFILPSGGRPIITMPPFLVISYEMTILLGVLFTLLGFHFVSGLPAMQDKPYDERFNVDRFGVILPCHGEARARAEQIIREAGAEEVKDVEDAS